jgi:hypothetical protein
MSDQQRILALARRSLVLLPVTMLIGVALYGGTAWFRERSRTQLSQVQEQVSASQANLANLQGDLANLQADVGRFAALREQGVVGRADRAAWVEQLLASRARVGLPDTLSYTLQPPMPVSSQGDSASDAGAAPAASPAAPGDATQAVFHDLDVALTNIHEQELLALLEDYRGHVKGRFRVNACALSARTEAGLTARCTLRFFTLPDDVPAAAAQ